jgi:hypothetical protein
MATAHVNDAARTAGEAMLFMVFSGWARSLDRMGRILCRTAVQVFGSAMKSS